jgi:hypothetical protein
MDWQDLINQTLLINKPHGRLIYVPGFQNQVAGGVFAVLFLLLFLQDAEGFARKIRANFFMDAPAIRPYCKVYSLALTLDFNFFYG